MYGIRERESVGVGMYGSIRERMCADASQS